MKEIGRLAKLGIALEDTRGTPVTTPDYWIQWLEITDPDNVVTYVKNSSSVGSIAENDGADVASVHAMVGWKAKIKDDHVGLPFYGMFGNVASVARSAPNAAVFDHTFTVTDVVTHPALTVAIKDVNIDEYYPTAVINTLTISATPGEYPTYEVKTLSKGSVTGSTTPAFTERKDFLQQQIVFKHAANQAALTAATATVIRNFTVTFNQNALAEQNLGLLDPTDILNQTLTVTGTITKTHNDNVFRDYSKAGTFRAMRLDMIRPDTIGASANPELKIDLYKCFFSDWKKNLNANGIVDETFNFEAVLSITDAAIAQIVLSNLVTSYT